MAEPYIYAQLLREGTSDDGLESILQATLIDVGCNPDSAIIPAPYPAGDKTISGGLNNILRQGTPQVVFVHRDADNAGAEARQDEISQATAAITTDVPVIPVIPVKETEAWILWALHNPDFRSKISGMESPELPPYKSIENCSAKERLHEVHSRWAQERGGKRNRRDRFERDRSIWLSLITDVEFLRGCPSYESLYSRCEQLVAAL